MNDPAKDDLMCKCIKARSGCCCLQDAAPPMTAAELANKKLESDNANLKAALAKLRVDVGTPFCSLLSHEDALERLRQINRRTYEP